MPKSDRLRNYTIGFLAGLILAGLVGFSFWKNAVGLDNEIALQTQKQAAQYADPAYVGIECETAVITATSKENCISAESEAANEAERGTYDLEAQQTVAVWTRVMGKAAIVGMGVGIIGLSLIFTTFWETRKAAHAGREANNIARTSSERQLRAYLGVRSCSIERLADGTGFLVQAELVNAGQTPAYHAKIMGESFGAEYPLIEKPPFLALVDGYESPVMPGETLVCAYRATSENMRQTFRDVLDGKIGIYIQGVCQYRDAFGMTRETKFRYVFGGRMANSGGLVMHADFSGNSAT